MIFYYCRADAVQGLAVRFYTKEDAVKFATRQGWTYWIEEPQESSIKPKGSLYIYKLFIPTDSLFIAYADNFKYNPKRLRLIKTK